MRPLLAFTLSISIIFSLSQCKTKPQVVSGDDQSSASADTLKNSADTAARSTTDSSTAQQDGITEKYWKLTELMGKPIPQTPADKKEIHIKFRSTNNLEGFGGCNGLGATFEIKEGDRITISSIIRTQMACPELDIENELIKVLETADNYNHSGDKLVLNKARMAPLARFEAVYFN